VAVAQHQYSINTASNLPITLACRTVLQYHFDRGLYMHEIVPGLFCGTQPRNPQEIEELSTNHGVTVIMNLQQDKDIQHWGVDFGANQHRANELGVTLLRKPVRTSETKSAGQPRLSSRLLCSSCVQPVLLLLTADVCL
jgi:hypothetical protein